jgi:hypothetical protein
MITVSWSMITVQYGNGRALSAATMHAVPASVAMIERIAAAPRCRSATAGRKARDTAPGAELEQH